MSMLGHYASFPELGIIGSFERFNYTPKGAIHIGAWDCPEEMCYSKLFGEKVIWGEAHPEIFKNVSEPIIKQYNQHIYNYFMSNVDDNIVQLQEPVHEHMSASSKFISAGGRVFDVMTKRLDTLMDENNHNPEEYDFLNIDAEGAELEILEGYSKYLHHVNVVFLEVNNNDRFGNGVTFDVITKYLADRGFEFLIVSDSINQIGWGDALYKRIGK